MIDSMKECITCKENKELSEYHTRTESGNLRKECKPCFRARRYRWKQNWKARNPEVYQAGLARQREYSKQPHVRSRLLRNMLRWRAENPGWQMRRYRSWNKGGVCVKMLIADYDRMLAEQDGKCAICFQPETAVRKKGKETVRQLSIDHDHETGEIRGLLCNKCNPALGGFRDNPQLLVNAISYLAKQRPEVKAA